MQKTAAKKLQKTSFWARTAYIFVSVEILGFIFGALCFDSAPFKNLTAKSLIGSYMFFPVTKGIGALRLKTVMSQIFLSILPMLVIFLSAFTMFTTVICSLVLLIRSALSGYALVALFYLMDKSSISMFFIYLAFVFCEIIVLGLYAATCRIAAAYKNYCSIRNLSPLQTLHSIKYVYDFFFFCGLNIFMFFVRGYVCGLL